jgi:hypothetical protein
MQQLPALYNTTKASLAAAPAAAACHELTIVLSSGLNTALSSVTAERISIGLNLACAITSLPWLSHGQHANAASTTIFVFVISVLCLCLRA